MCVCIRRKYKRDYAKFQSPPDNKPSYQPVTVGQSTGTITKNELELHPNPAYGAGDKMKMNSNPAYNTCNWSYHELCVSIYSG